MVTVLIALGVAALMVGLAALGYCAILLSGMISREEEKGGHSQ
jgi:hypothetical protein